MQLKRVDVNIRRAIRIKNRQFGIITRNKKKDKLLKSVLSNHIIVFRNYELTKTIVKAKYKVAKLITEKKIRLIFQIFPKNLY